MDVRALRAHDVKVFVVITDPNEKRKCKATIYNVKTGRWIMSRGPTELIGDVNFALG